MDINASRYTVMKNNISFTHPQTKVHRGEIRRRYCITTFASDCIQVGKNTFLT